MEMKWNIFMQVKRKENAELQVWRNKLNQDLFIEEEKEEKATALHQRRNPAKEEEVYLDLNCVKHHCCDIAL